MTFLVVGHTGWIGSMITNELNKRKQKWIGTTCRPENQASFEQELIASNASNVIVCIGRTYGPGFNNIDYLEQPGKLQTNIRDNLFGPTIIAILCNKYKIHCTYIGSGCIFEYTNYQKTFYENSIPNFFGSSYSTVKGYTDLLMRNLNVLNVRIRMPITSKDEPRNLISKLISYSSICSIENSMTVMDDIVPCIIELVLMNITGTINMTNPGTISHNTILSLYKKHVDPSFTWVNIESYNNRSNNCLDTTLFQTYFPHIKNINESVENIMKKFK
uniref:NAD-dependent epimerase/dehydratase domain-containing protein n=1 Tax=viral metagenome TaxID=1070528 RepID=A0A6C0J576_9ZZZZ